MLQQQIAAVTKRYFLQWLIVDISAAKEFLLTSVALSLLYQQQQIELLLS